MKIEIGESILLSWLRHIKECQVVQNNWKISPEWELGNYEKIDDIINTTDTHYKTKYNYSIFKQNTSTSQLLKQAEIDVLGIKFDNTSKHIYAVDVAFHENGLNYGSKEETISRILKKCIRSTLCIIGFFNVFEGTIIFASPKINKAIKEPLEKCIIELNEILRNLNLDFDIRLIANQNFQMKILNPVSGVINNVADTSELYMRSLQMYNMFAKQIYTPEIKVNTPVIKQAANLTAEISDDFSEMKIGAIARNKLRKVLESGIVPDEEINMMQTKEYSKETFHIQYPLLLKVQSASKKHPERYYALPIKIKGQLYYMCSEWFETPRNNDRPWLLKWLALHKE